MKRHESILGTFPASSFNSITTNKTADPDVIAFTTPDSEDVVPSDNMTFSEFCVQYIEPRLSEPQLSKCSDYPTPNFRFFDVNVFTFPLKIRLCFTSPNISLIQTGVVSDKHGSIIHVGIKHLISYLLNNVHHLVMQPMEIWLVLFSLGGWSEQQQQSSSLSS